MAKKVSSLNTDTVLGGPAKSGEAANLIQGVFVGVDSNGDVLPAEFAATAGPIEARGVVRENVQRKDALGNVLVTEKRVSYCYEGRISGLSGLTKGATYYLLSGGAITATKPAATTNDIDQPVGWAISDTELIIDIGDAVSHA